MTTSPRISVTKITCQYGHPCWRARCPRCHKVLAEHAKHATWARQTAIKAKHKCPKR